MSDTIGSNDPFHWTVGEDPFVVHLLANDKGYPSTWGGFQQVQADLLGDLAIGRISLYKDVVLAEVEDSFGRSFGEVEIPLPRLPQNVIHVLRMLEIMLTAPVAEQLDITARAVDNMVGVIAENVTTPDMLREQNGDDYLGDRRIVDTADL